MWSMFGHLPTTIIHVYQQANVSQQSQSLLSLIVYRFPRRRPVNDPPPLYGKLVNGRRTPSYALAWVCTPRELFKNLGGGVPGIVTSDTYMSVIAKKWIAPPNIPYVLVIFCLFLTLIRATDMACNLPSKWLWMGTFISSPCSMSASSIILNEPEILIRIHSLKQRGSRWVWTKTHLSKPRCSGFGILWVGLKWRNARKS